MTPPCLEVKASHLSLLFSPHRAILRRWQCSSELVPLAMSHMGGVATGRPKESNSALGSDCLGASFWHLHSPRERVRSVPVSLLQNGTVLVPPSSATVGLEFLYGKCLAHSKCSINDDRAEEASGPL